MEIIDTNTCNVRGFQYLAKGMEAEVFFKNKIAYKMYKEPKNYLYIPKKVTELNVLKHIPSVMIPQDVIYDTHTNAPVGITMELLTNIEYVNKLFTYKYKADNSIDTQTLNILVSKILSTIDEIHKCGIGISDISPNNMFISPSFDNIYFIDTDAWDTPSFPATVATDSYKDRRKGSSVKERDVFGIAVLVFQLYTNKHPYKGSHPTIPIQSWMTKMDKNLSIFHPDITAPKNMDTSMIPLNWMGWMKDVFTGDCRELPALGASNKKSTVSFTVNVTTGTSKVTKTIMKIYDSDILDIAYVDGNLYVLTEHGIHMNATETKFNKPIGNGYIVFTDKNTPLVITKMYDMLHIFDAQTKKVVSDINVKMVSYNVHNNYVYVLTDNSVECVSFVEMREIIKHSHPSASASLYTTQQYKGCTIQHMHNTTLVQLFDRLEVDEGPYTPMITTLDVHELDGKKVIDAYYSNNWLFVTYTNSDATKDLLRLKVINNNKYVHSIDKDIDYSLNVCVKNDGTVVLNTIGDDVELFKEIKNSLKVEYTQVFNSDMLYVGKTTMCVNGNKLYSLK